MPSYWEQRAIDSIGRMEKAVNGQIPDLVKAFEQARRDLNDTVFKFYARYAANNKISLADAQKQLSLSELREFRGNLAEFEQLAKNSIGTFNLQVDNLSVKARVTRLEALQAQCDAILQKLYQEQRDQIAGTSADIYTSEYYHHLFDIEQYTGFQFPYSGPDASAVRKVIEQPVYGMDLSEHLWRQNIDTGFKIRQTLTNMFVTGRPPQDFADQLQKQIGAVRVKPDGIAAGTGKKYEAYRLLYTESAHVTNQAQLQACNDDGIDEFEDIVTLDSHTCPYCAGFDGKHYPVSKAIEGVNCPPWHPFCRCTTAPYIPELADLSSTRASRDPVTGKTVPTAAQTYDEWKVQQGTKYGAGTVDIERKKVQNEASDFKQYQRMKPVLKENSPKSFAEFQNLKYNNSEGWGKTMRNAKLFSKIDGKEQYSPEYKAKLKETYGYFSRNGFEITEHGLNRIVGQKAGKDKIFFTKEQLLGILRKGFNYEQPDGKRVKFYDGVAVIQAQDTGEVVSVVTRSAARSDWRKL